MVAFLRGVFVFALVTSLIACERDTQIRCETCGMLTDLAPSWTVVVDGEAGREFDTPKCALRSSVTPARLRFKEYYSGEAQAGAQLRFVIGSDVLGPMGEDLVPVDPETANQFVQEHGGEAYTFETAIGQLGTIP